MVRAMGLLDFFKKKSAIEKHGERVAKRRTANADRWESIQTLGRMATTEPVGRKPDEREAAVAALMERFTFYVDPTITDGEEKDETFRWICQSGEVAVAPICAALGKHESVSWGLKCLEQVLSPDDLLAEMLKLLATMDTDYERDPQRKVQLLGILEEKRHPDIAEAVVRFLLDIDESARFHAFGAVLAQENAEDHTEAINEALAEEDSVRVKVSVFETLAERQWAVSDDVEVPEGWFKDKRGIPRLSKKKKK